MNEAQEATVRSSIGSPEVVSHVVKHARIILKLAKLSDTASSKVSIIVILAVKAKFSSTGSSKKISTNKCDIDKQPEITTQTGSTYISKNTTDIIEIPTENLGCLT